MIQGVKIDLHWSIEITRRETRLVYAGPNPTCWEEAWTITLAKWELLTDFPCDDGGPCSCGLCLYADSLGDRCQPCPIWNLAHSWGCSDTPYDRYREALHYSILSDEVRGRAAEELRWLRDVYTQWHDKKREKEVEEYARAYLAQG